MNVVIESFNQLGNPTIYGNGYQIFTGENVNNSGIISDRLNLTDQSVVSKYASGQHALVTQGGGQRGIFTAGVLDELLQQQWDPFDRFYGTSAGALNITSFLTQQLGFARRYITQVTTRSEFFSLFKHLNRSQRLDLDWGFEQLQQDYYLDMAQGRLNLGQRQAYAAVTNVDDLQDYYLPIMADNGLQALKASCAIPGLYRNPVMIDGHSYVDGGVSATIPAQEAWRNGARLITVIRTEPVETLEQVAAEESPAEELKQMGFSRSFYQLQEKLLRSTASWKLDLQKMLMDKITQSERFQQHSQSLPVLNGGRWLYGGGDIYRLSHLLGEQFDNRLMDMLVVHHQTYSLTRNFMLTPPVDCFILQVAPSEPLKSSAMLSDLEDLDYDYQLGRQAGQRYIQQLTHFKSLNIAPAIDVNSYTQGWG